MRFFNRPCMMCVDQQFEATFSTIVNFIVHPPSGEFPLRTTIYIPPKRAHSAQFLSVFGAFSYTWPVAVLVFFYSSVVRPWKHTWAYGSNPQRNTIHLRQTFQQKLSWCKSSEARSVESLPLARPKIRSSHILSMLPAFIWGKTSRPSDSLLIVPVA